MRPLFFLSFVSACVCAQAATVTLNDSVLVNKSPTRIGVNVSTSNYYDSGQLFKNLLFTLNPGFEGFIQQEIIGCASGSATTCVNYYQPDQAPSNYWAGATAYFCCSASPANSNLELTRTISSSTTGTGSVGPTYTFSSPLPQPVATDDYFSVALQVNSTGSSVPGWSLSGAATGETSNISPGSAGVQALSLPSGACAAAYADTTTTHDFILLQTGQTFGFSFKTISISGSPVITISITRLGGLGGGVAPSSATLTPGSSWATQSASFSGNESTGIIYGDLQVQLCNIGTGVAYVDDVDLERTSNLNASNTSVYRDEVVSSLMAINPGSLRLWDYQLGETLADWTNPLFGRHFQSSLEGQPYVTSTSGRNAGATAQGLMDFLSLCEQLGAKPWITIPLSWPASDYSNLIDFLASGPGTTYGAKRIDNGHAATYTSTLGNIYIEFGNEPWNSAFAGIDMPNFSYASTTNGMLSYAHWSKTAMSLMKANASFSPALKLIVNMQAATTYEYTNHILPNNAYLDAVSIAPYIGTGQLDSAGTFAAEWNPETAFTWGDTNDTAGAAGDGFTYAYVHAGAKPVYVYEDNENQVNGTVSATILQNHNSSFMAGTVVTQQMLEHLKILGPNAPQQIWSLGQDQFLNASSVQIPLYGIMKEAGGEWAGNGNYIQRPLALAAQIANDSIIGPEYSSAVTNADTYATGASNGLAAESNVPYEFAYCFENNSNRSCVLVNTDPSNSHGFTFVGPNVPTSVTTRVLSMTGNTIDTCNNESSRPCVSIVTTNGVPVSGDAITVAPGTIEGIDFEGGSSTPAQVPVVIATGNTCTYNGSPCNGSGSATGVRGETLAPLILSYSNSGYGPSTTAPSNAGTYAMTATFSGNGVYESGTSAPVTVTVNPAQTFIGASCGYTSFPYGSNYSCNVNVGSNAGGAQGVITYTLDNGTPVSLALSSGIAQLSLTTPNAGSHTVTIGYAQQGNFALASANTQNFTVAQAPTQISLTPSNYYPAAGSPLTLSASMTSYSAGPATSGVVTFLDNGTAIGTGNVDAQGLASVSIPAIAAAYHSYVAQFGGSPNFAAGASGTLGVAAR